MSAIIENTEVRSARATRTPKAVKREVSTDVSFIDSIKNYFIKGRMAKAWNSRNLSHGDVFVETLEVESVVFQQNLFIEETKSISDKLERLGFIEQTIFPDYERYQVFSTTYYNERHNLAVTLFPTKYKSILETANLISTKTTNDLLSGLDIFLNTVAILIEKSK